MRTPRPPRPESLDTPGVQISIFRRLALFRRAYSACCSFLAMTLHSSQYLARLPWTIYGFPHRAQRRTLSSWKISASSPAASVSFRSTFRKNLQHTDRLRSCGQATSSPSSSSRQFRSSRRLQQCSRMIRLASHHWRSVMRTREPSAFRSMGG